MKMEKATLSYVPITVCQVGEEMPSMNLKNTLCKDGILVIREMTPEFLNKIVICPFFINITHPDGTIEKSLHLQAYIELRRPD